MTLIIGSHFLRWVMSWIHIEVSLSVICSVNEKHILWIFVKVGDAWYFLGILESRVTSYDTCSKFRLARVVKFTELPNEKTEVKTKPTRKDTRVTSDTPHVFEIAKIQTRAHLFSQNIESLVSKKAHFPHYFLPSFQIYPPIPPCTKGGGQ